MDTVRRAGSIAGVDSSMLRVGAPAKYNMDCYSRAFFPATVDAFLALGKKEGIPCAVNMLMWVHNEMANISRYNPRVSYFEHGRPGIQVGPFLAAW